MTEIIDSAAIASTSTANSGSAANSARTARATSADRGTHRRLVRLATVGGAVASTTAIFLVARAAGTDFVITDPGPAKPPFTFVAPIIAIFTLIFALLGWTTLAGLERWTRHPRLIWGILAGTVVLLSFVPIGYERASMDTQIMLGVIHVTVAVALLPMLRQSRDR